MLPKHLHMIRTYMTQDLFQFEAMSTTCMLSSLLLHQIISQPLNQVHETHATSFVVRITREAIKRTSFIQYIIYIFHRLLIVWTSMDVHMVVQVLVVCQQIEVSQCALKIGKNIAKTNALYTRITSCILRISFCNIFLNG